ncbi:MAG: CHASE2 domain-containing protein [Calditrichaeota bacterium]|nr:MAG: CHASE2 domain-containing protein [Calditrichota bacterium]
MKLFLSKQFLIYFACTLGIFYVCHSLVCAFPPVREWNARHGDFLNVLFPAALNEHLVFIDINQASIDELTGSEWAENDFISRKLFVRLFNALAENAHDILVDVVFNDVSDPVTDAALVTAAENGKFHHAVSLLDLDVTKHISISDSSVLAFDRSDLLTDPIGTDMFFAHTAILPYAPLLQSIKHLGHTSFFIQQPGSRIRSAPLLVNYAEANLPALAFSTFLSFSAAQCTLDNAELLLEKDQEGIQHFPLKENLQLPISFLDREHIIHSVNQYFQLVDLLPLREELGTAPFTTLRENPYLNDKIIVIGSTTARDVHDTAVASAYPGAFIHLSMVNTLLNGTGLIQAKIATLTATVLLFLLTFLFINLGWRSKFKFPLTLWTLAMSVLLIGLDFWLYESGRIFSLVNAEFALILVPISSSIARRAVRIFGIADIEALLQDYRKKAVERHKIFISYAHEDTQWMELLVKYLKHAERENKISYFIDTRINPGMKWNREIKSNLDQTKVAVLLVSEDFIASDYIMEYELPYFVGQEANSNIHILWMLLRPCPLPKSITDIQALHKVDIPLTELSEIERNRELNAIAEAIINAAQ